MANLKKLKKDGECVGYMRLEKVAPELDVLVWRCSIDGKINWTHYRKFWPSFDEAVDYVCDDKNNDKVFAGDKIKARIPDISSEYLIGRIVQNSNPLNCWMFKYNTEEGEYLEPAPDLIDIELMEDKDNG